MVIFLIFIIIIILGIIIIGLYAVLKKSKYAYFNQKFIENAEEEARKIIENANKKSAAILNEAKEQIMLANKKYKEYVNNIKESNINEIYASSVVIQARKDAEEIINAAQAKADFLANINNYSNIIDINKTTYHEHAITQRKALTKSLKNHIKERDNYTCQYCGKYMPDEVGLHIDHKIPVSKGGQSVQSNLQVLCSKCNWQKGRK